MCGINLICSLSRDQELTKVNEIEIRKMNDLIKYRGPDNNGLYLNSHNYFGHNRLAIVDLNQNSNQPFLSSSKRTVVVFNGEIYNYKVLRQELISQGYKFKSKSDTEVINAIYELNGDKGLDRLKGMYVFAIFDKVRNITLIRRDRFGIKPFYYFIQDKKLYGSSEMAPLISIIKNRRINSLALNSFFIFDNNNCYEESFIKGIYKLEPGEQLIINQFCFTTSKWFDLKEYSKKTIINSKDLNLLLEDQISKSISQQSNTEVKTCIFFRRN